MITKHHHDYIKWRDFHYNKYDDFLDWCDTVGKPPGTSIEKLTPFSRKLILIYKYEGYTGREYDN